MKTPFSKARRLALALIAAAITLAAPLSAAPRKKVDVNTASQQELEALPGVGAATAAKIIAGRPYSTINDLSRAGVSDATIEKVKPLASASRVKSEEKSPSKAPAAREPSGSKARSASKAEAAEKAPRAEKAPKAQAAASGPVDLNSASPEELEALPGVGKATAKKIVAGRPYSSVDDLARAGVSKATIAKISSSVVVRGGSRASAAPASRASAPAPDHGSSPSSSRSTSSSAPASTRASSTSPDEPEVEARTPPSRGMVWVNTSTKVYHVEGDRWYGRTKEGKFMSEKDAIREGYRASKQATPKN